MIAILLSLTISLIVAVFMYDWSNEENETQYLFRLLVAHLYNNRHIEDFDELMHSFVVICQSKGIEVGRFESEAIHSAKCKGILRGCDFYFDGIDCISVISDKGYVDIRYSENSENSEGEPHFKFMH